ncbi:MAG: putative toxin-antitoxin system toxin component, PIN family [Planctomycetes bacterium]|nr:putative toxin-antitoxin system toxin component, PIN family [Planctomycetota bacterium]
MRTVLDTNVFVSGIFWRGRPHQVLRQWESGRFDIVVSPAILTEYLTVLDEFGEGFDDWRAWRDLILARTLAVAPEEEIRGVCRDPADDKFLSAAAAGAVDAIVSGDRDLLCLGSFRGIPILTPAAFLELLLRDTA